MKRAAFPVLALSVLSLLAASTLAQDGKGKSKARDARGGRGVQEERTRDTGKRAEQGERRVRDAERGKDRAQDAARESVRDVRRMEDKPRQAGRAEDKGRDVVDGARGGKRAKDGARGEVRDVRRMEDKPRQAGRAEDKGRDVVDGVRGQERALVQELVHHREMLARLEKLSEVFGSKSKDPAAGEKLGRVRKLRGKEMARHGAAMERYRGTMGAANVEEILLRDTVSRGKRDTDRQGVREVPDGERPGDGGEHAEGGKRSEDARDGKDRDS